MAEKFYDDIAAKPATGASTVPTDTASVPNDIATATPAAGTTATAQTSTAPTTTAAATEPATSTTPASNAYNQQMTSEINKMYDAQRQSALSQLESGYNRTRSDAQAAYDKISPAYQESRNQAGAEYERQRRNNNLQASANGINTGSGSQMQLAQSNVYQSGQAKLHEAENQALNEANRNMLNLKEQYEADVNQALADNDAQRAAALLNEYGKQYDRLSEEAKALAAYGDFSLYETIYGAETASQMEKTWMLQNPALAYTLGKITPEEYFSMTGKYPNGYSAGGGGGGGSSSGGRGYYGGSGGGGGQEAYNTITAEEYKQIKAANPDATDKEIATAAKEAGYNLPVKTVAESYGTRATPQALQTNTHGGSGGVIPEKKSLLQTAYDKVTSLFK